MKNSVRKVLIDIHLWFSGHRENLPPPEERWVGSVSLVTDTPTRREHRWKVCAERSHRRQGRSTVETGAASTESGESCDEAVLFERRSGWSAAIEAGGLDFAKLQPRRFGFEPRSRETIDRSAKPSQLDSPRNRLPCCRNQDTSRSGFDSISDAEK